MGTEGPGGRNGFRGFRGHWSRPVRGIPRLWSSPPGRVTESANRTNAVWSQLSKDGRISSFHMSRFRDATLNKHVEYGVCG